MCRVLTIPSRAFMFLAPRFPIGAKTGQIPRATWTLPKIPYVVLPGGMARQAGARLGDLAVVFNARNGKSSYAIFADIGTMGEGSVALARNLGIREDARNGGTRGGIRYLVFPGSGNGQPMSLDEINAGADKQFQAWGGAERLGSCPVNANRPPAFNAKPQ